MSAQALRQCRDALETAKNGLAWYRDRCTDAVDGSDDEASAEIDEATAAADAALSAAPAPAETVTLVGVKNGVETVLGEVPMPPNMKARELVREMFGAWEPDDGSDPDLAMAVCEQLIEWMGKQANASLAAPAPAQAVPLTEVQIADVVREHLTSTYVCTRVWEAWSVGTMTEDDFTPASETDMADDIAGALISAALTETTNEPSS